MRLSRLWAVAKLDLLHNLRRPIYWIWALIVALVSWGLSNGGVVIQSGDSQTGGDKAWLTSEYGVTFVLALIVFLLYPFFLSVAAGMPIIRDDELKVSETLHASELRPGEYVWGRFLAVVLSVGALLAFHLAATAFCFHVLADDELVGPFAAGNYLRPAVFLVLPLLAFMAGTAFAVGERFRRPILVFVLPVAIWLFCVFFLFEWSPDWLDPRVNYALQLVDPSGFRWLSETWLKDDRGVEFYNTTAIQYEWPFLLSRLAMVAIGVVSVVASHRHMALAARGARVRSHRRAERRLASGAVRPVASHDELVPVPATPLAGLGMRSKPRSWVSAALSVARVELRELRNQPGIYLFAPLILVEAVAVGMFNLGAFDTPMLNTPGILAARMMNVLNLLVCLLLMFYTVESLARERRTGVDGMAYAAPVATSAMLFGKALANSLVGAVILVVGFLACAVVLLVQGTVAITIDPFVILWGVVLVPTFLFWSSFVAFVQSLVRSRYTTYALCLGALIWTGYRRQMGDTTWATNWNAWSVTQWSDMDGIAFNAQALALNRALVLTAAALLVAATVRFFDRREFDSVRTLHRLRPLSLLKGGALLLPFAVAPIVLAIVLVIKVDAGFQGERAEERQKDYWRRNVATFTDHPLPGIDRADIELELDPERRRLRSKGTFTLSNHRSEPLRVIPLTGGLHWEDVEWTVGDGRRSYEMEDRGGLYVFKLAEPLLQGEQVEIGFSFEGVVPKGITKNGGGCPEFLLPSGVVLTGFSPSFAPVLGYMEEIGIDDDNSFDARRYYDGFHEGATDALFGSNSPCTTSIRITAPEEYTLNSVGTLVEETVEDGKRTALWESDHPVYMFNVVAGKWDVRRGDGTAIFYHPEHHYNIDEMLEALDGARRYYSEWFMPYPWQELKLSEFPALAGYAQGFPTNITFSEAIGFLTKSDPRAAAAFMVTAHEAAHQWWGNILLPGKGPGGNILSEGMAHFSTILLADQVKGERFRIEFCKRIEGTYCEERQPDSELPLVWIDGSRAGDTTVTYDKGGWVFWMLLNHMGRADALRGIQAFIAKYDLAEDHAVLFDFVREMRPYATDGEAYDAFCAQWFLDVVLPEYRLADASVEEAAGGGKWTVAVKVENVGTGTMPLEVAAVRGARFTEDEEGVDEGVDGPAPEEPTNGAVLAAERDGSGHGGGPDDGERYRESRTAVVLGPGESQLVTIECAFEPERVLVDPDARVLQLRREQAVLEL